VRSKLLGHRSNPRSREEERCRCDSPGLRLFSREQQVCPALPGGGRWLYRPFARSDRSDGRQSEGASNYESGGCAGGAGFRWRFKFRTGSAQNRGANGLPFYVKGGSGRRRQGVEVGSFFPRSFFRLSCGSLRGRLVLRGSEALRRKVYSETPARGDSDLGGQIWPSDSSLRPRMLYPTPSSENYRRV